MKPVALERLLKSWIKKYPRFKVGVAAYPANMWYIWDEEPWPSQGLMSIENDRLEVVGLLANRAKPKFFRAADPKFFENLANFLNTLPTWNKSVGGYNERQLKKLPHFIKKARR